MRREARGAVCLLFYLWAAVEFVRAVGNRAI